MDNKKLQKIIEELQAKSKVPSATAASSDAVIKPQTLSANGMTLQSEIVSYPNEYFEIIAVNGEPFGGGSRIGLSSGDSFEVEVNYEKVLQDYGPHAVLRFMGITKMYHLEYSVYSPSGALVGNYNCQLDGGNYYGVQLDTVYRKTGSANFVFKANWSGSESIALNRCAMLAGIDNRLNPAKIMEIITPPTKINYREGEVFDASGMAVTVEYDDGLIEEITSFTYSENRITASQTSIEISYNDIISSSQPITVVGIDTIDVDTASVKTVYEEGEVFDASGMVVTATYADGITNAITGYALSTQGKLTLTDTNISITFMGFSCQLPITVRKFSHIYVATMPAKMNYLFYETFDATGMVVKKVYTNGDEEEITDYTISNTMLTGNNKTVTISYLDNLTSLTLTVEGQRIDVDTKLQKAQYYTEDWVDDEDHPLWGHIYGSIDPSKQLNYRSVVTIPRNIINFCGAESVNIKMRLTLDDFIVMGGADPIDRLDFNVNGQTFVKKQNFKETIIDLGVFNTSETVIELIFTRFANSYSFVASGENAPILYVTPVNSVGTQNTVKEIPLLENIKAKVDIYSGKTQVAIDLLPPDKSLLGYGITYIPEEKDTLRFNGKNIRLNLDERLICTDVDVNGGKSYVYEDALGNLRGFNVTAYYFLNGDRQFLDEEQCKQIRTESGQYYYEEKQVYIDTQTINNQFLLTEPTEIVANSEFYQNSTDKPIVWLKGNGITKGFNSDGSLIMVNDDFGNYFTVSHDNSGRITGVTDCNGKNIQFIYSEFKLSSIKYAPDKEIVFDYFSNAFISTNRDLFKPRSISFPGHTLSINLNYDNSISKIKSSDGYECEFNYYGFSKIKSVIYYSTLKKVPDEGQSVKTQISRLDFGYNAAYRTVVTDSDNNELVYIFNKKGENIEFYKVTAGIVTEAEKYEYSAFEGSKKIKAAENTLYKSPLAEYSFVNGEITTTTFDKLNNVKTVETVNTPLTDTAVKSSKTWHFYDVNHRLYKITTEETYGDKTINYAQIIDFYGQTGSPSQIRNYKMLPEDTSQFEGRFTDFSYNEKGDVVKEQTFISSFDNYLGNEEKFISEYTYDANRRMTEEKNESGQNSVKYAYKQNTDLINKVTFPGGSVYEYNYDTRDRTTKMFATVENVENANTTEYNKDEVIKLNHSGNVPITYEYDEKRRLSKIYVNGAFYESYTYEDDVTVDGRKADKVTKTNALGENITVTADKLKKTTTVQYNEACVNTRTYDYEQNTETTVDGIANTQRVLHYDTYGNLLSATNKAGSYETTENYSYDKFGRIINDNGCAYKYSGLLNEYVSEAKTGEITVTPKVDVNGRYMGRTVKYDNATVLDESVDYVKGADNRATNIPKQIQFGTNNVLRYNYDGRRNISAIKKNGEIIVSYRYDILDRLTAEHNKTLNKSIYYTYDNNGNITGKKETEYGNTQGTVTIRSYVYSNGRMISYDGEQCEYDAMGNPTTYRNKTLQWAYGRRLMNYDGNTFKYDAYGMRVGKNETVYLHDAKGRLRKQSDGLEFIYDNAGLLGLKYNGATYIYRKNIQGDIIAILDSTGDVVVEYTYDAWGNHTVSGSDTILGNLNPFRYRGYYYDTETGLYYLQTRYYDPETGRFLNMDSIAYADPETINGLNLYAYCGNNPVMNVDPTGHLFFTILLVGLVAGAVIGATVNGVNAYNDGARGLELAGAIAKGAVVGGAIGAAAGAVVGLGAEMIGLGLSIGGGISGGGAAAASLSLVSVGAIALGGATVAGGVAVGAYGLNVVFSKGNGSRFGHNQHENGQFEAAMHELGYSKADHEIWEYAHRELGYAKKAGEYFDRYKDLLEFLRSILG